MNKIPPEWLTQRVEDAPTSFHRDVAPGAALRVRSAWQKLKSQATEGDELWSFSSPGNQRKKPGRYVGYALVREGKILKSTLIS
ncbi:MAG: hypothetical protein WD737_03045 [Gemmatimonadota bacterium]